MGSLGAMLTHPDDIYPLVKLKMAMRNAEKQIPSDPHWGFCYSMLHKVFRSFALVIQQLGPELRNAVCIFYLVLRALGTIEDDTSIPSDIKVPILKASTVIYMIVTGISHMHPNLRADSSKHHKSGQRFALRQRG